MPELVNFTPLAATCVPSMSLDDQELALLLVVGRFQLPAPGRFSDALALHEAEVHIPLEDSYLGEPGRSSLYWEGQASCVRPAPTSTCAATRGPPGAGR